jgi:hypothetical protein
VYSNDTQLMDFCEVSLSACVGVVWRACHAAESWREIKGMRGDTLTNRVKRDDIIVDAGWRGLHVTTEFMKRFVKKYYRRPHSKSYFSGCGAGGRQGIKAMSSFPEDYDGLV